MTFFRSALPTILAVLAIAHAYPAPDNSITDEDIKKVAQGLITVVQGVANITKLIGDIQERRPPQSAAVTGQLLCNGNASSDVHLELYDHDSKFLSMGMDLS